MKNILPLCHFHGTNNNFFPFSDRKIRLAIRSGLASFLLIFGLITNIYATPITINVTATIAFVDGDYVGQLDVGQEITGTFIYETDEENANPGAITTPSNVEGHEFSSFYEFSSPPYDVSLSVPIASYSFDNVAPVAVVVNDNLPLVADDTAGFGPVGTLDWIEILGGTTVGICLLEDPPGCEPNEYVPADGEEWTLAIFANDSNWFSDGSIIPDNLPSSDTRLIVGGRFDEFGNETGLVIATISTVPVPAAVWLFGSALGLLGWMRRKAA